MPEVIPIGADHAGFELKERLIEELRALGYEPLDLGTSSRNPSTIRTTRTRWPARVEHHEAARGVLLCGTGLGMAYAANRHPGSARRWPGPRRSHGWRGSTTTPTFWSCRRGS